MSMPINKHNLKDNRVHHLHVLCGQFHIQHFNLQHSGIVVSESIRTVESLKYVLSGP